MGTKGSLVYGGSINGVQLEIVGEFREKSWPQQQVFLILRKTTEPRAYNRLVFGGSLTRLARPGWPYLDIPRSIRPPRIQI